MPDMNIKEFNDAVPGAFGLDGRHGSDDAKPALRFGSGIQPRWLRLRCQYLGTTCDKAGRNFRSDQACHNIPLPRPASRTADLGNAASEVVCHFGGEVLKTRPPQQSRALHECLASCHEH